MNRKLIFVLAGLILLLINSISQEFPQVQNPPRLVNDFASFLDPSEADALEEKLLTFDRETSTQISIVIVPSLNGYEKADYSFQLAEQWGIGSKDKNNGILILIKPKTPGEKGEVFIAVGYGLEGVVPDAITKRIVDLEIIPNFQQGKNFKALDDATNTLISLTKGEFSADEYLGKHDQDLAAPSSTLVIFILIILISIFSRLRRTRQYAIGKNIPFWTALFLASAASRSNRGAFGHFSSGSGGFGGGGFGGFGGGGFGGGGAGGSW